MRSGRVPLIAALLLAVSVTLVASHGTLMANPFLQGASPGAATNRIETAPERADAPSSNWLFYHLAKIQRGLNESLTDGMRALQEDGGLGAFAWLVLLALVYGFFHGVGPGHGKNMILAWIMAAPRRKLQVVRVSLLAAALHAGSAVLLVAGSYLLFREASGWSDAEVNRVLQLASWALLLVIGAVMLVQFAFKLHRREIGKEHEHAAAAPRRYDGLGIAAAIGLVPCPISSLIFLFAMSAELIVPGLLLVVAFAAGMGLAILAVAFAGYFALRGAEGLSRFRFIKWTLLYLVPPTAAVILVLLGFFGVLAAAGA